MKPRTSTQIKFKKENVQTISVNSNQWIGFFISWSIFWNGLKHIQVIMWCFSFIRTPFFVSECIFFRWNKSKSLRHGKPYKLYVYENIKKYTSIRQLPCSNSTIATLEQNVKKVLIILFSPLLTTQN